MEASSHNLELNGVETDVTHLLVVVLFLVALLEAFGVLLELAQVHVDVLDEGEVAVGEPDENAPEDVVDGVDDIVADEGEEVHEEKHHHYEEKEEDFIIEAGHDVERQETAVGRGTHLTAGVVAHLGRPELWNLKF